MYPSNFYAESVTGVQVGWHAGWQEGKTWQNHEQVARSYPCSSPGVLHGPVHFGYTLAPLQTYLFVPAPMGAVGSLACCKWGEFVLRPGVPLGTWARRGSALPVSSQRQQVIALGAHGSSQDLGQMKCWVARDAARATHSLEQQQLWLTS